MWFGQNASAQRHGSFRGCIAVGNTEVDAPVRRCRRIFVDFEAAEEVGLVVGCQQRIVRVGHHAHAPAENSLVEAHGRFGLSHVQFDPAHRSGLAPFLCAGVGARLRYGERCARGVGELGNGRLIEHVGGRHPDESSRGLDSLRAVPQRLGLEIEHPLWCWFGDERRPDGRDEVALMRQPRVMARIGAGVGGLPTEQAAVELDAGGHVGGRQVDPVRCSFNEFRCHFAPLSQRLRLMGVVVTTIAIRLPVEVGDMCRFRR